MSIWLTLVEHFCKVVQLYMLFISTVNPALALGIARVECTIRLSFSIILAKIWSSSAHCEPRTDNGHLFWFLPLSASRTIIMFLSAQHCLSVAIEFWSFYIIPQ